MKDIEEEWKKAQAYEKAWWLGARDQHVAELRKSEHVGRMLHIDRGVPQSTVIDIGCGPFSLLLRVPVKDGVALDPIWYDDLEEAYKQKGIRRLVKPGEELTKDDGTFDEAWIYNCLQHVKDPDAIIRNAMEVANVVRIFEWINIEPYEGHLHKLSADSIGSRFLAHSWYIIQTGVGRLDMDDLHGTYFMGIFTR